MDQVNQGMDQEMDPVENQEKKVKMEKKMVDLVRI
jgi:hypothetical protein